MSGAFLSQASTSKIQPQRSKEADDEPPYPGAACVICLNQELSDPTILDCCKHIFCYDCINQWLLTNPSCPMCKKHLNKIKHGLHPIPKAFPVPYNSVNGNEKTVEDLLADYEMGFLREQSNVPLSHERRCVEERLEHLYHKTIRLRSLATDAELATQEIEQKRTALTDEIKNLSQLKTMIMNKAKRSVVFNSPTFRRLIYDSNLAPRPRLAPRFPADASPNGIIANEALFRRRLIPFLIRELTAIIERSTIDMSRFLDFVMNYLKCIKRTDRHAIANKLQAAGIAHPLHFLNNVAQFLSSGQRMEVYDENCEYRPRGSAGDLRAFIHGPVDNDVEFLNETITIGPGYIGGSLRPLRAMDNWAENMRREYYTSVANNPPAPHSPPLIVLDDQNNEPDIDFFRYPPPRRGSNSDIRAFFTGPPSSSADNDVELLNEALPPGFRQPRSIGGPWSTASARRPFFNSFANNPPSPNAPQIITLEEPSGNDSDVEVVPQTTTTTPGCSSNPAPKRPRISSPDLH